MNNIPRLAIVPELVAMNGGLTLAERGLLLSLIITGGDAGALNIDKDRDKPGDVFASLQKAGYVVRNGNQVLFTQKCWSASGQSDLSIIDQMSQVCKKHYKVIDPFFLNPHTERWVLDKILAIDEQPETSRALIDAWADFCQQSHKPYPSVKAFIKAHDGWDSIKVGKNSTASGADSVLDETLKLI